jgi:hypothetical protein
MIFTGTRAGKVLGVPRPPRRTKKGDAFLERARRTFGSDEAQFEWLLRVLDTNIDQLPVAAMIELYREAWFILDRGEGRGMADISDAKVRIRPFERDIWKRVQQDVGALLRNLAIDNFHVYKITTSADPVALSPNTAWQFGEDWEWIFFRTPGGLVRRFSGTLPTRLLVAAADLLDRLGSHRLKTCPHKINGTDCGRLFLARRAQKYCSRKHATGAAWLRWLEKHHGGTRAKTG